MRDPVGPQLDKADAILQRLIRDHPLVKIGLANAQTPDPEHRTNGEQTEHVDMTSVEAAGERRRRSGVDDYQRAADYALFHLKVATKWLALADVIRGRVAKVDTSKETAASRCDGWDDPTCTEIGDNKWLKDDETGARTQHVLCPKCYAKYRQRKARGTA